MIKHVKVKNFEAVPYLEPSALMQAAHREVSFSLNKPNVVIGPNGSGKSALLKAIAIYSLSYFTGSSSLDDNSTSLGMEGRNFWGKSGYWPPRFQFLPGLDVESDDAPARYYRPGHIPGNNSMIATAMMCGYNMEARAYGRMVGEKSSGQGCSARLNDILALLKGETSMDGYSQTNWRFRTEPATLDQRHSPMDWEYQAEQMKARVRAVSADAVPMILMDEPEQSLDALAELDLWHRILDSDRTRLQVVVATHSLYPLMHQDKFHIVEAEKGYSAKVVKLL